jgi:hypothetical protein
MLRPIIALLLPAAAVYAQTVIDPARYWPLVRMLDPQPGESALSCEVTPVRPSLNFSFRYQAGYVVRVPMAQFTGAGHVWSVLIEIAPEGAAPVYLSRRFPLPEIPRTGLQAEFAGGYLLGEGRYRARWVMVDERQRVCRHQWGIEVKPSFSDRHVRASMPPLTVSEFTWASRTDQPKSPGEARRSLTILLDVAPLSPRRLRLRGADRLMFLALTSALLEAVPANHVKLVAFSLDQQKEIFRRDTLGPGDLDQLAQALENVELATVDYRVLQNRGGYRELLARLVREEVQAAPPSDDVVILGPAVRFLDKVPAAMLEGAGTPPPRFSYFQYRPAFRRPVSYFPDTINQLISRLKGKSFVIRTPADFNRAIQRLNR